MARISKPLPALPDEVLDDVDRLIGFDAAQRADGKIAQSLVDEGLQRLRRAFEKHGLDALIEGIEVAIGKRKGLFYAAGCVRHRGALAAEDDSLFGRRHDDDEAPLELQSLDEYHEVVS